MHVVVMELRPYQELWLALDQNITGYKNGDGCLQDTPIPLRDDTEGNIWHGTLII